MKIPSVLSAAATAALLIGGGAVAHREPHRSERHPVRPVPVAQVDHLRTSGAWLCEGNLIVSYARERFDPATKSWGLLLDDGQVAVQVERAGAWVTLPTISGGEGVRRVQNTTAAELDKVRAVRTDSALAASARLVSASCPA